MSNEYKTGDICPKSGNWLLVENNKIEQIIKGDKFGGYYEKVRETENGVSIYNTEEKRAHWQYLP